MLIDIARSFLVVDQAVPIASGICHRRSRARCRAAASQIVAAWRSSGPKRSSSQGGGRFGGQGDSSSVYSTSSPCGGAAAFSAGLGRR